MSTSAQLAIALLALTTSVAAATPALSAAADAEFRETYRELVETDTTLVNGNCTAAAEKMAARLQRAGFTEGDVHTYATAEHPKEGGLVAVLRAPRPRDRGVLLVAHIDVVAVNRADWQRDPFTLGEAAGYFYGRGVSDNKAMAAALIDTMTRLKRAGVKPRRDIKVALTCGEETATAFNGASYLAQSQRALIDAEYALVPSAGARLDAQGRPLALSIQAGEKIQQSFQLTTTHPGGHSSRPVKHDAIARLSAALVKLAEFDFPVRLNEVTRAYFTHTAQLESGERAAALRTLGSTTPEATPDAQTASLIANADAGWNSMMRTTCATTLLQGGEALNALAQRATATVNCRLLPGDTIAATQQTLAKVIDDPSVTITRVGPDSVMPAAPPLTHAVLDPIKAIAAQVWPGTPVIPTLLTGATDARHFNAVGIPTYGITAVFNDPDGNGVHAPNERVRVSAVYQGREFIYRLLKRYAGVGP